MSKFEGKFRKDSDYDEVNYAKIKKSIQKKRSDEALAKRVITHIESEKIPRKRRTED